VVLVALALVWLYPLIWTFANSVRTSADIYRAAWDVPWPPVLSNFEEAWTKGKLGLALGNSLYVTTLTVIAVLILAIPGAFALTRLRPPMRVVLMAVMLAPLVIPTEVLFVPLFTMFRSMGLLNRLEGLVIYDTIAVVSLATVILSGFFRTIPRDVEDAARVDGAGRAQVLRFVIVPMARAGIVAVAVLVAVFTWNDYFGALVLIQKGEQFTAQLALSRFSTYYETDQGLTFAGLAIIIIPPLLLFLVLQRSFVRGLTAGATRG
jgi:raffinose/stachyose/melibiose transport system permease protein